MHKIKQIVFFAAAFAVQDVYASNVMTERGYCEGLAFYARQNQKQLFDKVWTDNLVKLQSLDARYLEVFGKEHDACYKKATSKTTFDDLKLCLINSASTHSQKSFNEGFYLALNRNARGEVISVDDAMQFCGGVIVQILQK